MNLRITLLAFLCLCATAILRAERVDYVESGMQKSKWEKLINTKLNKFKRLTV
mgnify:CR=1 FL=1